VSYETIRHAETSEEAGMVVAANSVLVLGWVFIIVGLLFMIVSVPALLKKAYAADVQTMGWGDIIGKIISEGGAAGVVAALGLILILIGLVMIGVKLPDI
jgi:hypothetical protein